MDVNSVLSFTLVAILFNAAPGPSVFFVSSIGALKGKSAAIFSALGLATGSIIHALLAGIGVTALVAASETISILIAFFGGLYVIYLGVSGFMKPSDESKKINLTVKDQSMANYYRQGIIVEFLNPKTILFYTSILSGLLTLGNYQPHQAILVSLIVPATALPIDILFGIAGGYMLNLSQNNERSTRMITSLSSFSLIGIGAYLIWNNVLSALNPPI